MIGKRTDTQNNKFLAYVRVSSKDQSRGTSLDEQKARILQYAETNKLSVVDFYDETKSAATSGRKDFETMIRHLKRERLVGIIFHKVDRSSRNPRDTVVLYELMLEKFQLHFAAEGISSEDNMGRSLLHIMWGVASAYIENLKNEINKGITGRLKQGRLPGPPPLGYFRKKMKKMKQIAVLISIQPERL